MTSLINNILTFFYMLIGATFLIASIESVRDKTNTARFGTAAFWLIFAIIFGIGQWLPNAVVGALLLVIGALSY